MDALRRGFKFLDWLDVFFVVEVGLVLLNMLVVEVIRSMRKFRRIFSMVEYFDNNPYLANWDAQSFLMLNGCIWRNTTNNNIFK